MVFLELRRQCGVSHEVQRGAQGASCVAPGKSDLPCEWRGGARHCSRVTVGASGLKRVEEGLSRSFSGCGRKPWVPLTCASELRELLRVPLRGQGYCGVGRGLSGLHWDWCNGRGPRLEFRQESQGSFRFLTPIAGSLQS